MPYWHYPLLGFHQCDKLYRWCGRAVRQPLCYCHAVLWLIFKETLGTYVIANFLFAAVLLAYLYFNSSPSSMLMGDAGSRALGFYIAVIAIKSQHPVIYLLLAGVLIIDGGLGLVKVFLKRFLKISILKNTRTPIQ